VTEHKSSAEQLLDLLLYAPVGLLGEARSLLPELAEKGRIRVGNARMMGQMAVQLGQTQAERRLTQLEEHAKRSLTGYGLLPPDPEESGSDDGADTPVRAVRAVEAAPRPRAAHRKPAGAPVAEAPEADAAPAAPAPADPADATELAIPDYDSLAASQVVSRLAGLREPELAAVQRYELATRGRKTILGKIAQLQAG
jgi:hypothetical protein